MNRNVLRLQCVVCVVPAHNEAETIAQVLKQLPKTVCRYRVVTVVVDDGSTDDTAMIASSVADYVIVLPANQGVGAATRAGFRYVSWLHKRGKENVRHVFKFDGDGQHVPCASVLTDMLEKLDEGAVIVTGSRFTPESEQHGTPFDRITLNCMFAHVVSQITGWNITDARTGFMGMQFAVAAAIVPHLVVDRYGIPINILLAAWSVARSKGARPVHAEVTLPALYSGEIAASRIRMYAEEDLETKAARARDGYDALLRVILHLEIDAAELCMSCFGEKQKEVVRIYL